MPERLIAVLYCSHAVQTSGATSLFRQLLFSMAFGGNDDKVPRQRKEERPASLSQPVPRTKLPGDLQKMVDREEEFLESLYEGE